MILLNSVASVAGFALLGSHVVHAIPLNLTSPGSIKQAASSIAHDMMGFYTGHLPGDVPGNLPSPYYWWEAGAMFGAMVDYWRYTGDNSYNKVVSDALLFQVGPLENFMPPNQTKTEGNDDQCFWGLTTMSAAESNFPDPPKGRPQWLALSKAVFNSQVRRWDTNTCGGGLRWQIYPFNIGYTYKNTISNGCFFNLASRLAKYTGNDTYARWAEKSWDWMATAGLLDNKYKVYDGCDTDNCGKIDPVQWTYNTGTLLLGAANMYNYTAGSDMWGGRTWGLLQAASIFFKDGIMQEVACEPIGRCNVDQQSFKAFLARWMGATTKAAPFTYDKVMAYLRPSAVAAAQQCSGGQNGRMCGLSWTQRSHWDGSTGVGQQMAALEVIQATLLHQVAGPVTGSTGGTSNGDSPLATEQPSTNRYLPATTADKAGAGILTAMLLIMMIGFIWWIVV